MSLTEAEVAVCNQALNMIGSLQFTYAAQTTVEGVKANLHYTQVRNALLRSFEWTFAKHRVSLTAHTTSPDFEWEYRYKLPDDYLRLTQDYTIDDSCYVDERFEIEGNFILSNNSPLEIKYIKKVTDPDDFDPLFTEVLILRLALRLLYPLAGTKSNTLKDSLARDLEEAERHARIVCRQESNTSGRSDWNQARRTDSTAELNDPV